MTTDNPTIENKTKLLGEQGEKAAADYLRRAGFQIVMANFKVPVGRNRRGALVTGEIDLIAYEQDTLCFVEVKTRRSDEFTSPLSAIDLRKQRQIIRAARLYRKIFHLEQTKFRYDAVSVVWRDDAHLKVEIFRNFFNEQKFRKIFGS